MCANFVVSETADSLLAQILVFRRVLDDQRTSSVFWSQFLAVRSSPHHSSTIVKTHRLLFFKYNVQAYQYLVLYRVAQKSKPLPNDQRIILNRQSVRLDLFVKLKYESSSVMSFVAIRYSVCNLLTDLNN